MVETLVIAIRQLLLSLGTSAMTRMQKSRKSVQNGQTALHPNQPQLLLPNQVWENGFNFISIATLCINEIRINLTYKMFLCFKPDTTKLPATENPEKHPPKIWIWIVIVVLILCILAVIGVWLYLKKKKSGGNGGGGQKYDDVPQDAK